jgi:hypothetical protein
MQIWYNSNTGYFGQPPAAFSLGGLRYTGNIPDEIYNMIGWHRCVPFIVPEGLLQIPDTRHAEKIDGVWTEIWATETHEEREARLLAKPAEQAAADLSTHGGKLAELAHLLAGFPGIEPGMAYEQICDVVDAHVASRTGEEHSRATAASLRAQQIYRDILVPAGIVQDRFWRAIHILKQISQQQQPEEEQTP